MGRAADLGEESATQLRRLVDLREGLRLERSAAVSPAVGRALEDAEAQLFLALSYLGYADELFPEERP